MTVGKFLLKVKNVAYIRTSELIDTLIIITDHTEIPAFCRKKTDESVLGVVCVLILVNQYVSELVLIIFKNIGEFLKKLNRLDD